MKADRYMTPRVRRRRCSIFVFRLVGAAFLLISFNMIPGSLMQLTMLGFATVLFLLGRMVNNAIRSI